MIDKDETILTFITKLQSIINFELIEVVDYWDGDLCAIGFKRKDRLVYVSTYNNLKTKNIKYDYDLELLNELEKDKIAVLKRGRNVSEREIIKELREFLKV